MKLAVASPSTGTQKSYEIDDEKKLSHLIDKRISQEFDAGLLLDEFKGYTMKIVGGQDKQGFPMKQGVLVNSRVRLLVKRGDIAFKRWRGKTGERRRKSVRGCIFGYDIALLNVIITHEGENKVEGLNDHVVPRRLGPKRANNIRKLFNLTKEDDVRKFVIRRHLPATDKRKAKTKAPKIQRLITPAVLERKRRRKGMLMRARAKSHRETAQYQAMLDRRRILSAHKKKARAVVLLNKQKTKENKKLKTLRKKNRIKMLKAEERKKNPSKSAPKPKAKAAAKAPAKKAAAKK